MCLDLVAIPAEAGQVSAQALSEVSGLTVTKSNRPVRNAFHFSRERGCSCSLLTDEADWSQPTWALDPGVLAGLAKAVELIADRAKGLTFQAIWIGDEPESQNRVPLKQLLRDIRGNVIKNKHVYLVGLTSACSRRRRAGFRGTAGFGPRAFAAEAHVRRRGTSQMLTGLYRRTVIAIRIACALVGRKYLHDAIAIRGDDAFVRATVEALELLKSSVPDVYALVKRHVGDIVSGKPSGVFTSILGFGPTVVLMGPSFSKGSVVEYAGTLAHEVYHCELYVSASGNSTRGCVPGEAYSGGHAESLCLRYQCDVLRRLGLDEAQIGRYEKRLAEHWWELPVERRDW